MATVLDSKAYMHMLYFKKKMTPEQIAAKVGVSHMTVYRALRKHGFIK